jgi:hypothetical protein
MKSSSFLAALGFVSGFAFLSAGCSAGSKSGPTDAGDAAGDHAGGAICTASDDDLISDFTLDNGVHPVDGRRGGWYTYADKSGLGTLTPPEGGNAAPDLATGNSACSGAGSLHVSAVNFTDWGAATGVDIMPKIADSTGAMVKGAYNASKYRGVAFWAKAATPLKFVQVKFNDPWTDIPSVLPADQRCLFDATMPTKNCSPYIVKFGYGNEGDPTVAADFPAYASYKIDTTWKRFQILFAETKQDSFNPGQKSPNDKLDVSQLMGMALQVNSDHSTTPPTPNDFEIWIDDVSFIK